MNINKKKLYFTLELIILLIISFFIRNISYQYDYIYKFLKHIFSYFKSIELNLFYVVVNYIIISFIDMRFKLKFLGRKYDDVQINLDRIFKFIYIPNLKVRNANIKKDDFLFLIIAIPATTLSIEFSTLCFFYSAYTCCKFIIITLLFIILSRIKDIFIILKAYLYPCIMYITFNEQGSKILKQQNNIRESHINIYFLYEEYEKYSIEELYMEKMIISTRIFKYKNKKFFDTYIFPILMIVISCTPTILNIYLGDYIRRLDITLLSNEMEKIISLYYILLGLIVFFIICIVIFYRIFNYNDISKLKLRESVIDNLIVKREGLQNKFKGTLNCERFLKE